MNDREAVTELIIAYSHILDDQRYDALARLFVEDAVMVFYGSENRGRATIIDAVHATQPESPGKHFTGTPVVYRVDDQTMYAWTDLLGVLPSVGGGWSLVGVARYHDVLEKTSSDWRFRARFLVRPGEELMAGAPDFYLTRGDG